MNKAKRVKRAKLKAKHLNIRRSRSVDLRVPRKPVFTVPYKDGEGAITTPTLSHLDNVINTDSDNTRSLVEKYIDKFTDRIIKDLEAKQS